MAVDSPHRPLVLERLAGPTAARVSFAAVEGATELFTPSFVDYLVFLHQRFTPEIHRLRHQRAEVLARALHDGVLPTFPARTEAQAGEWEVSPVPDELKKPGIEISGPAALTGMFINGLNPGPEGTRAEGDLDDDEDSAGHRFADTVRAAWNRKQAVERTLRYDDAEKGKEYRI